MFIRPDRERGSPRLSAPPSAGFTLLELMVALAILSIIMGALYLSLGTGAAHVRRVEDRLEAQQAARLALQRMAADLEGAYLPFTQARATLNGERVDAREGRADQLNFLSVLYTWPEGETRTDDLVFISYLLESRPEGGERFLVRQERPAHGAFSSKPARSMVLLDGVGELAFEYFDRQGRPAEAWPPLGAEGKDFLPLAIRVTISLSGRGEGGLRFSTLLPIPMGLFPANGAGGATQGIPGGSPGTPNPGGAPK